LLQAGKKSPRADQLRCGLQDAQLGISLHRQNQLPERGRIDEAVGIEHDHMVVTSAPSGHEVLDIARLARNVEPSPPIPNRHDRTQGRAQLGDLQGLANPRIGVGGVGQHDDLESAMRIDELQCLRHRLQRGGGARRILVIGGHHQRGQGARGRRLESRIAPFRRARQDRPGCKCNPTQGHGEEKYHRALQQRHAGEAHDLQHLIDAVHGHAQGHHNQDEPRIQHLGRNQMPLGPPRFMLQILRRHAHGRLGRHSARRISFECGAGI
jgi:hypothetical protein